MTAAQRKAFEKWRQKYPDTCRTSTVSPSVLRRVCESFIEGWNAAPEPSRWSAKLPTRAGLYAYKVHPGVQGVLLLIQEDNDGLYTRGFGLMPVEPAVVHKVYRPRSWPGGFWCPIQECGVSTIDP